MNMKYRLEYQSLKNLDESTEVRNTAELRSFCAKHGMTVGDYDRDVITFLESGYSYEMCYPNGTDKIIVTRL